MFVFLGNLEVRFASYYNHHMVLQKAPAKAIIWGFINNATNLSESVVVKAIVTGNNNRSESVGKIFEGIFLTLYLSN